MSNREKILDTLRELLPQTKAEYGVKRIALFGSWAKGKETSSSDIDILVEFESSPSFDSYMGLRLLLTDRLDHPVHLVTLPALRPGLASAIQSEAINVV